MDFGQWRTNSQDFAGLDNIMIVGLVTDKLDNKGLDIQRRTDFTYKLPSKRRFSQSIKN